MSRLATLALYACLCAAAAPACSSNEGDPGRDVGDAGPLAESDAATGDADGSDASFDGPDASDAPDAAPQPDASDCAAFDDSLSPLGALTVLRDCARSNADANAKEAALDEFVDFVEARGGFPIVEAGQIAFVYLDRERFDAEDDTHDSAEDWAPGRRGAPIEVAGDFNDWAPGTEARFEELWDGVFTCALTLTPSPESRWRYKFKARDTAGAEVWFSDPLSRRFEYDENGRISLVRGGTTKGHLERWRAFESAHVAARDLYLYLPPGYDAGSARYPVLYMHDGNNLFDTRQPRSAGASWDVDGVEELELAAGNVRAHIVVGIPNTDARFDEYTHVADTIEWEGRQQVLGGQGEAYARFLVEEVKPAVDSRYRTSPDKANTAIFGSSLGGLISYYVAWRFPETFQFVGGMSGTFGWGYFRGETRIIDLYAGVSDLSARGHVYYLDAGGTYPEGGCPAEGSYDGIGDDELCDVDRMKATLEAKGINRYPNDANSFPVEPGDANIYHYWEPGAPHSESAWNARLYRALRFFFPNRQ